MATLTLTIAASTDDAVINDAGYADDSNSSSSAQVVGTPGSSPTAAGSGQGWRFTGAGALAGGSINSAYLSLMKNGNNWNTVNYRWTAILEAATAAFSSGSPPGSRSIATNIAAQSLNVSVTDGTRYQRPSTLALQQTLGNALDEVIALGGWADVLGIVNQSKQDASQQSGFSREQYHDYDSATAASEPQLVIDYTAGAGGGGTARPFARRATRVWTRS